MTKRIAAATVCLSLLLAVSLTAQPQPPAKSAMAVLAGADSLELISLVPDKDKKAKPKKSFHGYAVLGATVIKKKAEREAVVKALKKSFSERATPARCFIPRHGVRAMHKGKTVELLICFQCQQLYLYEGKKKRTWHPFAKSAEETLDKILKAAGIAKAK